MNDIKSEYTVINENLNNIIDYQKEIYGATDSNS